MGRQAESTSFKSLSQKTNKKKKTSAFAMFKLKSVTPNIKVSKNKI